LPVIMRGAASWAGRSAAWGFALWLVLSPLTAVAENWTITPQLGDEETYTDNLLLTPTHRRSDLVTTLSPSLSISGASARLQGSLNYSPTAYLYALTPKLDAVGQNLYADGTATLVPNRLFIDAHAYSALLPTNPGLATGGLAGVPSLPGATFGALGTGVTTAIPTNQLSQTTSFDASPYMVGHFGGFGTGELRYTVSNTSFGAPSTSPLTPPGFAVLASSNTLTNEGTAAFLTGENFGRFASRIVLDAARQSGTGATFRASQTIAVDDSSFAVTRRIFPLASLGYENIRYSGIPPIRHVDAIWGIGLRLVPLPNASLTALYGHRYGVTAPYVAFSYAVTPRTSVAVTYSEALTTTAEQIADNLAVSAASPALHMIVDTRTQLPFAIVNPALGLQSGVVFRTSQLTGTATLDRERNHFALSAYRTNNPVVARSTAGLGASQQTIGGNAQWTRNLTPRTNAILGIGDAQFNFPGQPQFAENLLTAGLTLTHALTRTVNGWAGYSFFRRTSPTPQLRILSNVVLVGISKVF
jgi:uncharacterized protein (PEP-CTERM system associated)